MIRMSLLVAALLASGVSLAADPKLSHEETLEIQVSDLKIEQIQKTMKETAERLGAELAPYINRRDAICKKYSVDLAAGDRINPDGTIARKPPAPKPDPKAKKPKK